MTTTTRTSREFSEDVAGARRAAAEGPVIITEGGRPAHVLMTFEQYRALTMERGSIVELLGMPGAEEIEFEPPRMGRVSDEAAGVLVLDSWEGRMGE